MHVPDGFLDARTCAASLCLAASGVGWATVQARREWSDRTLPLLGVMSAFVFAGQMVNFPVAGGTSGHLMGGALAAILLGPAAGILCLTTVLLVQCLLFQDGGITALGANILNLSILGAGTGYLAFRALQWFLPQKRWIPIRAAGAAWVSVVLAAAACAAELALAETVPFRLVVPAMTLTHVAIGLGEAAITFAVISFVFQVRPDLIYEPHRGTSAPFPRGKLVGYGLAASLGVVLLLAPFASSLPDGLERVAARLGFEHQSRTVSASPLPDYTMPGVRSERLATILAGSAGLLTVFIVTLGGGRILAGAGEKARRTRTDSPS